MTQQRVLYFDILNICACLCVVFLHFNSLTFSYEPTAAWKQSLAVEVLCYWAVPIFFMLSGATLMKYRERYGTKEFFKKRVLRTFVPFLFWSVAITVLKIVMGNIDVSSWNFYDYFDYIFNTKVEPVYWFFIPLFATYLCMPVLSLLADEKNKKTLWYIVGAAVALNGTIPILSSFIGLPWNGNLYVPVFSGYLVFVVLGYLLSITDIKKEMRFFLYALGLLSAVFRYLVTYRLSISAGETVQKLFDYTQFHSVFLAIGVFVLFKQIPWNKMFKNEKGISIIAKISSCSFGIYLIHMLLQRIAVYIVKIPENCWEWRLLLPIAVYFVGLAIVYVMKQIPIIKRLVP